MVYVAASDYVEYINLQNYDSDTHEALYLGFEERARGFIELYTGRDFAATETARLFDADSDVDGRTLYLDADLVSVGAITLGDSDATAVTTDLYVTEPRNDTPYYALKLLDSSGLSWSQDSDPESTISVTGSWGYSTEASPEIQQVTLRLMKWIDDQRSGTGDNDRPIRTAEGLTIMPASLPTDVMDVLRYYKRRRVGGIG